MKNVINFKLNAYKLSKDTFSISSNKKRITFIMAIVIIFTIALSFAIINTSKAFGNDSNTYAEHVPGEVIAWLATESYSSAAQANDLQNEDTASLRAQANSKIDEFLTKYDCTTLACYTGDDETYCSVSNDASYITVKNPLLNTEANITNSNAEIPVQERVVSVKFDETQNTMSNIIADLEKNPLVKFAEPNYIGHLDSVGDLTQYQYAYDTEGATGTTHNKAGMNVEGWNGSTPNIPENEKVVAAVIDSGVDTAHPDIPLAGREGGYNLTQIAPGGQFGYNATAKDIQSEEAKDPTDVAGHGTHVSGSVAAKWDNDSTVNDKGISGAASKCYILPIRIGTSDGNTYIDAYVKGTAYIIAAKQAGVNIKSVNNSWSEAFPSETINENATKTGLAGMISVFTSSNRNQNTDIYRNTTSAFSNNPYVITVDSTNDKGYKSNFSNYGVRTTDVCAPGSNILSSVPTYDILQPSGEYENLRISDTRVLEKGTDYTMIDDFEDAEGKTNLQYYAPDATTKLPIVGSAEDPKGYKSDHAITLSADNKSYLYIVGDFSTYIKQGEVNNITLLLNTDIGKQEIENSIWVSIYSVSSSGEKIPIAQCSGSTAEFGYMPVSFSASLIPDLTNAKIIIYYDYVDENYQSKNVTTYIDNVAMAHTEMPYTYLGGTSMAAPAVTGVSAVVANKFSSEPIDKIVARIKGGTNKKQWLKDVCYSGGIVDLKRACSDVAQLDPIVQKAKMNMSGNGSTIVELTGYFLGDNNSTVTINGQTATNVIQSKKDELDVLTCTFANPITGEAKTTVTKQNGNTLTRYFDLGDSSNLLETLPQPPKNDTRFDDYYSACDTKMLSASDNYILINAISQLGAGHYYKYNINNMEWSPSDMKTKIQEKIGDNCFPGFLNSKGNTQYLAIFTGENVTGLLRYDIESEQVTDYEQFSESNITNPGWLIIEDDKVYLGNLTENGYDVYSYNYTDKKLNLITSNLQCGTKPKVFKQSDGHYVFIDNGTTAQSSSSEVVADVYNITLDDGGFSSEKSDIQAYPEQAKAYNQNNQISYAYWNGQIITFGPAVFEVNKNDQNAETYGYVTADSFSIDANTGKSTALPQVMQRYKVAKHSTRANNNTVYTSFIDTAGTIQIAKRVLDVPPSPKPPTPLPEPETATTTETGDANLGLLTLAIIVGVIASCSIAYSCRATRKISS